MARSMPLDEYSRKVVQSRRRGTIYPYELLRGLVGPRAGGRAEITGGSFVEHDLDADGRLDAVDRPPGCNTAGIVTGVVTNTTDRYPEGMARVALLGDPTRALGALAEPECRRIIGAIDLADAMKVPVEWFALSAGAKIAMDSGTENMDWIAAVLRRIIEFTQARRRDQRRGHRHQRRRPALLERRGHDAHAHQGHPRHDARQRDGAHRQDRRSTSRAASRPRTTTASAGTSG